MKAQEFLTQISDEKGPLQGQASDIIERMSHKDFIELCEDINRVTAPKITIIKVENMISGKLNIPIDNQNILEKVKDAFFESLKTIE